MLAKVLNVLAVPLLVFSLGILFGKYLEARAHDSEEKQRLAEYQMMLQDYGKADRMLDNLQHDMWTRCGSPDSTGRHLYRAPGEYPLWN